MRVLDRFRRVRSSLSEDSDSDELLVERLLLPLFAERCLNDLIVINLTKLRRNTDRVNANVNGSVAGDASSGDERICG